jgi:hypothetical protein
MDTLDSFFDQIDLILQSTKFSKCTYPVYRGHSKGSYQLLPTLQRDFRKTSKDLETLENNLYCDFRSLVGPRVHFSSSWEALFAMRHEGIPTRLLDWTENLGTALFFALDSVTLDSPEIWILNPFTLNSKSHGREVLLNPEEDFKADYQLSYADLCNDKTISIHELPIAIYPKRSNDRIFAQRGLFTIHGKDNRALEEIYPECVEKITIPQDHIPKLKKLLRNFGINKYSVYPDFKGLSDHLKELYNY